MRQSQSLALSISNVLKMGESDKPTLWCHPSDLPGELHWPVSSFATAHLCVRTARNKSNYCAPVSATDRSANSIGARLQGLAIGSPPTIVLHPCTGTPQPPQPEHSRRSRQSSTGRSSPSSEVAE